MDASKKCLYMGYEMGREGPALLLRQSWTRVVLVN
jgi:hypothetical protein